MGSGYSAREREREPSSVAFRMNRFHAHVAGHDVCAHAIYNALSPLFDGGGGVDKCRWAEWFMVFLYGNNDCFDIR